MDFKLKKNNLNFRAYTSPSIPSTGVQNDIVILSDVPMVNWTLSPDDPSGIPRTDGDVWIKYSVAGNTFNALKNNSMIIATIAAWQYVEGEWKDVEAMSYQNGEWASWLTYLYRDGNECVDITGGWKGKAWKSTSNDGQFADPFVLTKYGTYMHCSLGQNRTGVVTINKYISFKGKQKLYLQCSNVVNNNTSIGLRMAILSQNDTYWFSDANSIVSITNGVNSISLENYQNDNTYDFIIGAVTNEGSAEVSFDIEKVWLE